MIPTRTLIAILVICTTCACTGPDAPSTAPPEGTDSTGTSLAPLTNTPLRYDGFYRTRLGSTQYGLRFYPEGNVVLANGNDTTPDLSQLRSFLRNDVRNGQRPGLYNVPVIQNGDSLYFVTPADRGNIDYRGTVLAPDSVRFFKYSHINGQHATSTYTFQHDPAS